MTDPAHDPYAEAEAAAEADKGGGRFVSLKNDKDNTVGVFVGPPGVDYQVWVEGKDMVPPTPKGRYVPFTEAHKAAGINPKTNFIYNWYEIGSGSISSPPTPPKVDCHKSGVMKEFKMGTPTFKDVLKVRGKYESEPGKKDGLEMRVYEIERQGVAGDTKTKYVLLSERDLSAAERLAIFGDVTKGWDSPARGGMKIRTPAELLAGKGAHGDANDPDADMNSHENGSALITPEQGAALVGKVKLLDKEKIQAYKTFIASKGAEAAREIKVKDFAAVTAFVDKLAAPPAPPGATAEVDPFADLLDRSSEDR